MYERLALCAKEKYQLSCWEFLLVLGRHSKIMIKAAAFLTILISALSLAQLLGGDFEFIKNTIDSGGGTSSGGDFSLTGTIGQPDASLQASSGGGFRLEGGFWTSVSDVILKDGFEGD
jgi:hypothetical protein